MEFRLLFQPRDHFPRDFRHLFDVFNLSVHHRALPVILLFDIQHMEAPAFNTADHTDDAAGADVQRENLMLLLIPFHFRHSRTCLHFHYRIDSCSAPDGAEQMKPVPFSPFGESRPSGAGKQKDR